MQAKEDSVQLDMPALPRLKNISRSKKGARIEQRRFVSTVNRSQLPAQTSSGLSAIPLHTTRLPNTVPSDEAHQASLLWFCAGMQFVRTLGRYSMHSNGRHAAGNQRQEMMKTGYYSQVRLARIMIRRGGPAYCAVVSITWRGASWARQV